MKLLPHIDKQEITEWNDVSNGDLSVDKAIGGHLSWGWVNILSQVEGA